MKQALDALEQIDENGAYYDRQSIRATLDAIRVLKAALANPVAQAWEDGYRAGISDERTSEANIGIAGFGAKVDPARENPLRAAPAPVAQPLTDERIKVLSVGMAFESIVFARAVERACADAWGINLAGQEGGAA